MVFEFSKKIKNKWINHVLEFVEIIDFTDNMRHVLFKTWVRLGRQHSND